MKIQYNDGGRSEVTSYKSNHDCAVRAVAIAAGLPYRQVYDALHDLAPAIGREGVNRHDPAFNAYLRSLGFVRVDGITAMQDIPAGRVIAGTEGHYTAIIDSVIQDVRDESHKIVSHYWVKGINFHLVRRGRIVGGTLNASQVLVMRASLLRYNPVISIHVKSV